MRKYNEDEIVAVAMQLREDGLTYEEIALELGIPRTTLMRILNKHQIGIEIFDEESEFNNILEKALSTHNEAGFLNKAEAIIIVKTIQDLKEKLKNGNFNTALWLAEKLHTSATRFINTSKELVEEQRMDEEELITKLRELAKEIGLEVDNTDDTCDFVDLLPALKCGALEPRNFVKKRTGYQI